MPAEPFFDTNLLIYSISQGDPRRERAEALLAGGGFISVQVLNEFVNVARRKMKLDWNDVETALTDFADILYPPVEITRDQQRAAVLISREYRFSIYDAAVIASALAAGCSTLYTEDLQHGQVVAGLRVVNPFRHETYRS